MRVLARLADRNRESGRFGAGRASLRRKGGAVLASLLLHLAGLAGVVAAMRGSDAVPAGVRISLVTITIRQDSSPHSRPQRQQEIRSSAAHHTGRKVFPQEKPSVASPPAPIPAGPGSPPQMPASLASEASSTTLQSFVPASETRRAPAADPLEAYRLEVWRRILAARPRASQGAGRVVVRFGINREGRLLFSEISQSSGFPLLDKLALRTVRAAAPFSAPPAELPASSLIFVVPVDFHG